MRAIRWDEFRAVCWRVRKLPLAVAVIMAGAWFAGIVLLTLLTSVVGNNASSAFGGELGGFIDLTSEHAPRYYTIDEAGGVSIDSYFECQLWSSRRTGTNPLGVRWNDDEYVLGIAPRNAEGRTLESVLDTEEVAAYFDTVLREHGIIGSSPGPVWGQELAESRIVSTYTAQSYPQNIALWKEHETGWRWWWAAAHLLVPFVLGFVHTWLIVAAAALLIAWVRRPGDCTSCGYALRGLPRGTRCPECGALTGRTSSQKNPA